MSAEYTPSTQTVIRAYVEHYGKYVEDYPVSSREFHRWLSDIRREAFDEGFTACANWWEIHHYRGMAKELNPYVR